MAHIISFKTGKFELPKEKTNPLLQWIGVNLANTLYKAAEPVLGERGWRMEVARIGMGAAPGMDYTVEASEKAGEGAAVKWTVQIRNQRSFLQKLRGKKIMPSDDPLAAIVLAMLRRDDAITDIHTVMNGK